MTAARAARPVLDAAQTARFREQGWLVVEDVVDADVLHALRDQLAEWTEQSRAHRRPFGLLLPTLDGRPRFDMGSEHSAERPALRRVNNPSDISPAFLAAMRDSALPDAVADLVGPDLRFHHCKVNLKLPGSRTEVGLHQDFAYTPHSNDDLVTALLMLDDMTPDNGALQVLPGSHRGPLHSLYDGEHFTGQVAPSVAAAARPQMVTLTGRAGSACLMHTRLLHGSAANGSTQPRSLYICVYTAADAVPLAPSPMPNPNEGLIVRGRASRLARAVELAVELPPATRTVSFFATQGQDSAGG